MPSYATYTELENLTGSNLGETILEAIIDEAEREIDAKLDEYGLSGSGDIIKSATLKLSMAGLMTRRRFDGSQPASVGLGELTKSDSLDQAISALKKDAWALVDSFIETQTADRAGNYIYKVNG